VSLWGDSSLWVLPRDVSDHCPLVLKEGGWDWGPRPFRFNDYWLDNRSFKGVVEEAWRGFPSEGWMGFVLKEKLKGLKMKIKEWHKGEYGDMEAKIDKMVEKIRLLDVKGEDMGLCAEEILCRKNLFGDLWKLLKAKDSNLVQRARSRWLKDGDVNSKYFHKRVILRNNRNSIKAVKLGEE
jgi:hypothetical protein